MMSLSHLYLLGERHANECYFAAILISAIICANNIHPLDSSSLDTGQAITGPAMKQAEGLSPISPPYGRNLFPRCLLFPFPHLPKVFLICLTILKAHAGNHPIRRGRCGLEGLRRGTGADQAIG